MAKPASPSPSGDDLRERQLVQHRLAVDTVERCDREAQARGISRNKLIELLVESGLNRLPPAPTAKDFA
jgi:hypothetical protein